MQGSLPGGLFTGGLHHGVQRGGEVGFPAGGSHYHGQQSSWRDMRSIVPGLFVHEGVRPPLI
jgi:hypothetical protein